MEEKDYPIARTYFSEGLKNCDYSCIEKLTEIWETQPSQRRGMGRTIERCRECLIKLSKEKGLNTTNAMALLYSYYLIEGVGGEIDIEFAEQLKKEAAAILGLNVVAENGETKVDTSTIQITPLHIEPIPALSFSEKYTLFLAYTFSPTMPVGVSAGIFNKFGVMLGFKSSIQKRPDSEYDCNNSSILNINTNSYSYDFTQKEKWHSMMFTAQVLFPVITKKLLISAGGGYGKRDLYNNANLYDKKTGNQKSNIWCHNTEGSYKGAVVEAGLLYKHKHLTILGGVNSTSFKDLDGYVGIGYSF